MSKPKLPIPKTPGQVTAALKAIRDENARAIPTLDYRNPPKGPVLGITNRKPSLDDYDRGRI